jgi:COP9 signalosome complex subunit 3
LKKKIVQIITKSGRWRKEESLLNLKFKTKTPKLNKTIIKMSSTPSTTTTNNNSSTNANATGDSSTQLSTALTLILTSPQDLSQGIKRFLPILDNLSLHQLKQSLEQLRWVRGAGVNPEYIGKLTEGFCYLFGGRIYNNTTGLLDLDTFMDVGIILNYCDANKIAQVDSRFEGMCELFTRSAISLQKTHQAIGPLLVALAKRTASCGLTSFTPIHVNILEVCLQSNHFSLASRLASLGVIEIAPRRDGIPIPRYRGCIDVQLYFYYSGIAFAAMRQFENAFHAFGQCIAMPALRLSAIHVASAKKYVLCSLMVFGEIRPLPKYTFNSVEQQLDRFCTSYHKFTSAFETQNVQELKLSAQDGTFAHDGNLGLIQHVMLTSFPTTQIARLTGTYLSLSLVDIAKQASIDNLLVAEHKVLQMIATKRIRAMIDQRTGTIRFVDHYDDEDDVHTIQRKMNEITRIAKELQNLEARLVTSKAYVQKIVSRAATNSAWIGTGTGTGTGTTTTTATSSGGGSESMEGVKYS